MTTTNPNSLYNVIKTAVVDGKLPRDFSLPKHGDQELPFADGAMDGIFMFHMEHTPMNEDDRAQMVKAVDCMNRADYKASDEELKKLGSMASAIATPDEFQDYIYSHAVNPNDPIDPANPDEVRLTLKNICDTARWLIAESENVESVKFGLIVCEIFKSHPEDIKDVIRTLGLSDEFTIFSVWNLRNWPDGNDEIFDLIQKVRGWGRVHALNYLEPRTPEIRHWILMNGTDNDVMPAYTSITAWGKAGVNYFLEGDLTHEEFTAVSFILDALLDEGPADGISLIADQERFLNLYLDQAEKQPLNIIDYDAILALINWASEDDENMPSIYKRCEKILNSDACEAAAREAIKQGDGFTLAEALNIDYNETLLDLLQKNFETYHGQCWRLMKHEEYVDRVIEIFEENLPLELMKDEPSMRSGLGPEFNEYSKLLFVLQELDKYPGRGEKILITGLNSPVINNRYMALRALKTWTKITGKSIKQISPKIHDALYKLPSKEPDPKLKADILDLLRGKIYTATDLIPNAN